MYHDIFLKSPASYIPRSSKIYHISEQAFIEHLTQIKKSKVHVVSLPNLLSYQDSIVDLSIDVYAIGELPAGAKGIQ